jgi:hypothetical protein
MNRDFYIHIAHLFYAVANVDKHFEREEKKKIVEFTEQYFSESVEEEQSSEIIYETMRSLIQQKTTSDESYSIFKEYFSSHKKQFHDEVVHHILVTCHEIAAAFSKKNKSELILLARLQQLLKEA